MPENLKNLSKQLEKVKIQNVIKDKNKNVIKIKIHSFTLRQQVLTDFPPKELRSVIDQGKGYLKGIVVSISTFEGKVGVAVGVTKELTTKYDANACKNSFQGSWGKGGGGERILHRQVDQIKTVSKKAFTALNEKIS